MITKAINLGKIPFTLNNSYKGRPKTAAKINKYIMDKAVPAAYKYKSLSGAFFLNSAS